MTNERLIAASIALALSIPATAVLAEQRSDSMKRQDSSMQQRGASDMHRSGLAAMKVSDLEGKDVKNAEGKDIGEIKDVARGPDNQAYAIVGLGGFWGMGERDVAIPLVDLQMQDDDIVLASGKTEEQLKQEAASRETKDYEVLDDDQSLAEYVGGGAAGTTQMTFQQLDKNGDGYISADEAQGSPGLASQMQSADRDGDGRLDRSEFSAFEMQSE